VYNIFCFCSEDKLRKKYLTSIQHYVTYVRRSIAKNTVSVADELIGKERDVK